MDSAQSAIDARTAPPEAFHREVNISIVAADAATIVGPSALLKSQREP